ncbi:sulfite exporter TauE/SafE family protein [Candidatus Nitronereus thalassa]|uniref:Sulfite exporter TauE/SafE family protein n=1 Tax=Candidatus Nitronereus thalassa TaxID=3020898 RepID=A0ABU3K3B3_9BACT|nr:sulfite exporter TauE/SafE family protein [Candidatus Nitronereus thalassa]MDT7040887.1 sulfite exporter TauE/SafE family protein [Candidatus Nitronereus thalassa]
MDDLILSSLFLGFLLGLSHALDADHVVAVGTLAAETESLKRSSLLGICWGIGHTLTLTVIGSLVLSLKWQIPEIVATSMEVLVAGMIVGLGALLLWRARRPLTLHAHTHSHDDSTHTHVHVHVQNQEVHSHHHVRNSLQKAFGVGLVHGIAGSAALTLTVMATMPSIVLGLMYIVVFGTGTILGMFVMSTFISMPFIFLAQRAIHWHMPIKVCAGVFAMGFGSVLAWSLLT